MFNNSPARECICLSYIHNSLIFCCGTFKRFVSLLYLFQVSQFCMLTKTPVIEAMLDKPALWPNSTPSMSVVLAREILRAWYLNCCHNALLQMQCYGKMFFLDIVSWPDERNYSMCWEHSHRKRYHLVVFKVTILGGMPFITDPPCIFISCFSEMPAQVTIFHLLLQAQRVYREELKT